MASQLAALGARLRARRRALGVSATLTAEAAGISRATLHRIERGELSVTMGAWLCVAAALGLELDLREPGTAPPRRPRTPPRRIAVAKYPELKRIGWQLGEAATLSAKAALALYERNWRHVDAAGMSEQERALLLRLIETVGGGRLLV
jgi:transcriptional regulator with XRE-family HTH domain